MTVEYFADAESVLEGPDVDHGDEIAVARLVRDETVALEAIEGLPQRRTADLEPGRQIEFRETAAGLQRARLDHRLQGLVHRVPQRGFLRRSFHIARHLFNPHRSRGAATMQSTPCIQEARLLPRQKCRQTLLDSASASVTVKLHTI
jgi:hypothetical protein